MHVAATRLADRHGMHSRRATRRLIDAAERLNPDIIHLHNIHGYYLNVADLFTWLREAGRPVVWTLHDCWAFTGHCAYFLSRGCNKWQTGCHDCKLRRTYPASWLADRSEANWKMKREIFTSLPGLHIVTVGRWLDSVVAKSFLKDLPRTCIPNGVDLDTFRPCAEKSPVETPLLLGVAAGWRERKGLQQFVNMRSELPPQWRMRMVGLTREQIARLPKGIEAYEYIASPAELARHYSEASVLASPTSAECNNMTKMEALACGTPVVTYDSGGAGEGITSGCGAVVDYEDFPGLLRATLDAPLQYSPAACRATAEATFDMRSNFARYFELYESLIKA